MKLKIGVFGNGSSNHLSNESTDWIRNLGKEISRNNCTLYTGGGGGVMHIIRKSCLENKGNVVSIRPEVSVIDTDTEHLGSIIASGQGKIGRVHLLAQSIDIGIAIGGGSGTLMEIISCYLMAKPVIVIDGFQRVNDPKLNKMLHDTEEFKIKNQLVLRGYLDGKEKSTVEPVTICSSNLEANDIYELSIKLFEGAKTKVHNMNEF